MSDGKISRRGVLGGLAALFGAAAVGTARKDEAPEPLVIDLLGDARPLVHSTRNPCVHDWFSADGVTRCRHCLAWLKRDGEHVPIFQGWAGREDWTIQEIDPGAEPIDYTSPGHAMVADPVQEEIPDIWQHPDGTYTARFASGQELRSDDGVNWTGEIKRVKITGSFKL